MMKSTNPITVEWGLYTTLNLPSGSMFASVTNIDVLRAIARVASPKLSLYGSNKRERTAIDSYLTYCLSFEANIGYLNLLNSKLHSLTYLVGNKLSIADLAVFGEIYKRLDAVKKIGMPMHLQRWYDLIVANESVQAVIHILPNKPQQSRETGTPERNPNVGDRKQEGKFVELPGAEMGKVIVRFPPEASGYLHIGHAKAALLNQYYQQAFQGKLIMRFDDTNPAKETIEFEQVILEDLKMLEIKPDLFTHTSQYFDLMLEYCERLLKDGKAYADDTPAEQMKIERDQRAESKNRKNCKCFSCSSNN
jgi:bifunctional glutamyl/prolyl-tRNA synthetase